MLAVLALLKRSHKIESEYRVWEEGSHPRRIESEAARRRKSVYIHLDPVKRGYVDLPEHWRYSGSRHYAGAVGLVDAIKDWREFGKLALPDVVRKAAYIGLAKARSCAIVPDLFQDRHACRESGIQCHGGMA
ncbi:MULTISPECIES: hypothetical protein [Methylomonas]|uniref:hypothetical protein n=1 Tax=Methylomonas TaxID=416 RepID=UPI0007C96415|nr:hypothetical protein [Methylomonas koyamae]